MKIGKETEILEFKKSTSELKEAVISMSAILNKHGGGELIFGVQNNGIPLGLMISEKTLRDISQAIGNHLNPKVYPKISEVYIDDKACTSVEFTGTEPPYFAYGRAYIRVADEDKVMSPAELEDFILRKNAYNDTWDKLASDKTLDNLDEAVLLDYYERARLTGRIDFPYTTKEDTLIRLEMLKNGFLTNAAVAFFIGTQLLEVQMAIFAGTERLTFNDIQRNGGSIQQLVAIAEKYIRNNIRWRVVFDGSLQRKEIPEIPTDAVREAIINSFCHKDYKSSQNVTVSIYSNRVEIYNPGTFPDGLTPRDFIEGSEFSVRRNPSLSQIMYYVKDIESFGTGLKRITDACNDAGVKVEFKMLKLGFSVVFYRPDDQFNTTEKVSDGVESGVNGVINGVESGVINLSENETMVLDCIRNDSSVSKKRISEITGISPRTVDRVIAELRAKNIIDRQGPNKGGAWGLVKPKK